MALIKQPQLSATAATGPTETELVQLLNSAAERDCLHALANAPTLSDSGRQAMLQRLTDSHEARFQVLVLNRLMVGLSAAELEALLDLLGSDDAALRNQVIDALAQVRDKQIEAVLLAALDHRLQHDDADQRILSINLLAHWNAPQALDRLAAHLAQETHLNVAMTIVEVLVSAGAARHWPAIESLAQRFAAEPFVRFTVQTARRRLAAPSESD